jgi:hypothetical protein
MVKVDGGDITVTGQGTDYTLTYKKWPDLPHLVLTYSSFDLTTRTASEFRARAGLKLKKARPMRP